MGRTVLSFRQALNREITSWIEFRRGLSPKDRKYFDEMMDMARHHADASSLVARPVISEVMFMSIFTSMMKNITELQEQVKLLKKKAGIDGDVSK